MKRSAGLGLGLGFVAVVVACSGSEVEPAGDGDAAVGSSSGEGPGSSGGEQSSSGGSSGGTSSSGEPSSSGGSSSGGESSSSSGGSSSGGSGACTPGATEACALAPCGQGLRTCNAEGTAFSTCEGAAVECTGNTTWSKRFGNTDTNGPSERLISAARAVDGSVYIAGSYETGMAVGNLEVPTTTYERRGFLAKLNADGSTAWVRAASAGLFSVRELATDSQGNVVMIGTYGGSTGTARTDFGGGVEAIPTAPNLHQTFVASWFANGNLRFVKHFGSSNSTSTSGPLGLAIDAADRIYLTGSFNGSISFGGNLLQATGTEADAFVAKLDANGEHLWSRRYGDGQLQRCITVQADPASGDAIVGCTYLGAIDFGTGPLLTDVGQSVALARLGANDGTPVWVRKIASLRGTGTSLRARVRPNGGFLLTTGPATSNVTIAFEDGTTAQGSGYVIDFRSNGALHWVKAFTGSASFVASDLDSAGNAVLAGTLQGTANIGAGSITAFGNGQDALFAKFDATGALRWARVVGDSAQQDYMQQGTAVAVDPDGRSMVFGDFQGNINLGDGELVSGRGYGGYDVFAARLQP